MLPRPGQAAQPRPLAGTDGDHQGRGDRGVARLDPGLHLGQQEAVLGEPLLDASCLGLGVVGTQRVADSQRHRPLKLAPADAGLALEAELVKVGLGRDLDHHVQPVGALRRQDAGRRHACESDQVLHARAHRLDAVGLSAALRERGAQVAERGGIGGTNPDRRHRPADPGEGVRRVAGRCLRGHGSRGDRHCSHDQT